MIKVTTDSKESKRNINTTDRVDTQKVVKKDLSRNHIQVNFLIIREAFKLIKDASIKLSSFYDEIINSINPQNSYNQLVHSGNGDYKKIAQNLTTEYNIPIYYFSERYITADPSVIDACKDYLNALMEKKSDTGRYLKICEDTILKHVFTIKNPDGTLLVDKLREMHWELLKNKNNYTDHNSYMILESIVKKYPSGYYVYKDLKNFYENVADEYKKNKNNFVLPDTLKFTENFTPLKKYLTASKPDNFKLSKNLLLIREFYLFFAELDMIPDPLPNFYNFLEITAEDYSKMIDGTYIDCLDLYKKLEKFKYAPSYFRSVNAGAIYTSNLFDDALNEYHKTNDLVQLHNILRFELYYKIDFEYLPVVVATYSLISHIKLFIELGSNKEVYDNYLQLNSDPTFLD